MYFQASPWAASAVEETMLHILAVPVLTIVGRLCVCGERPGIRADIDNAGLNPRQIGISLE